MTDVVGISVCMAKALTTWKSSATASARLWRRTAWQRELKTLGLIW